MPETRTSPTLDSQFLQELVGLVRKGRDSLPENQKWSYGWHDIQNLAQDQVLIRIRRGSSTDTYRGRHVTTDEDSQSDYAKAPLGEQWPENARPFLELADYLLSGLRETRCLEQFNSACELEESSTDDELTEVLAVHLQAGSQGSGTTADDASQWTSDRLRSAILDPDSESDMPGLREMILVAENTSFTVSQSKRLAPWLLDFAKRRRDSSDPQDEAVVWAAIRTGASMLAPDAADKLRPLLEPGHSIETSLVTLKMLGRIFEAQPPADADQYVALAGEVRQIANSLLNRYVITVSQSGAMAHLAIYALAAMASSETLRVVETSRELGAAWFTRRLTRKLRELRQTWEDRTAPVADRPRELLHSALQLLEQD